MCLVHGTDPVFPDLDFCFECQDWFNTLRDPLDDLQAEAQAKAEAQTKAEAKAELDLSNDPDLSKEMYNELNRVKDNGDPNSFEAFGVSLSKKTLGRPLPGLEIRRKQTKILTFLKSEHIVEKNHFCVLCKVAGGASSLKLNKLRAKSHSKFGDMYSFRKFEYICLETKSVVICRTHGEFLISPRGHLEIGCYECAKEFLLATRY